MSSHTDAKSFLLASVAACGLLMHSAPAHAQVIVDIPPVGIMSQFLSAVGRLVSSVRVATVTTAQQVADASNTTNADFQLSLEEHRITRSHEVTPAVCAAVDADQALAVGARQTVASSVQIQQMMDQRIEGQLNTNGYQGSAQSAQSSNNDHNSLYCTALDQANGECRAVQPVWQGRDETASSLFGIPTYNAGDSDAAYAAVINATQPYVPRVRRGSEANSVSGQSTLPDRRQYDTNMSIAQAVGTRIISSHNQTIVDLGPDLQRQQVLDGRPATPKASWWDAMNLEIERHTSLAYHQNLARMTAEGTLRELAQLLIVQNQIVWAAYNQNDQRAMVEAGLLAYQAADHLHQAEAATGSTAPFPQVVGGR